MYTGGIADHWQAGLHINGKAVALSNQLLLEMTVRSGVHRTLPTCLIRIFDHGCQILEKIGPQDGMPLKIAMSDGRGGYDYSGNFIILGTPGAKTTRKGFVLSINGIWDAPAYMFSQANTWTKGTSTAAIANIAGRCGLKFDGDGTSDLQAWFPGAQTMAAFASSIAAKGHAGGSGAMVHGVTDRGVLRYKNITDIVGGVGGGKRFGGNGTEKGRIPILDMEVTSKAPAYNASGGYGSKLKGYDYLGKALGGALGGIGGATLAQMGSGLNGAASSIMSAMGGNPASVIHAPQHPGKGVIHDNYFEAMVQNRRVASTYSTDVKIVYPNSTDLAILDPAHFQCINMLDGSPIRQYSGGYVVSNLVRTVVGGWYFEKPTLSTNAAAGGE